MKKLRKSAGLLVAGTALLLALSACSSGAPAPQSTDAGDWEPVTLDLGTHQVEVQGPPRIAFFNAGSVNAYNQAIQTAVEEAVAEIPGATLTSFDQQFDPQRGLNMIENAIASGEYNAFLVYALDPNQYCKILSEDAPAAGIAVAVEGGAICGLSLEPRAEDQWQPGTLSVLTNITTDYEYAFFRNIAEKYEGDKKVIVLSGPDLFPTTANLNEALERIQKDFPDFQVVAQASTDFSLVEGQAQAQALLQAHPEANMIFTVYSDITLGAMAAVKEAGREGEIKIFDIGASTPIVEGIKAGTVEAAAPYFPISNGRSMIEVIHTAFRGEEWPRYVKNDGGPITADSDPETGMFWLDRKNVDSFTPEY